MTRYIKRIAIIEAVQNVEDKGNLTLEHPRWLINALMDGRLIAKDSALLLNVEGEEVVTINQGDWICHNDGVLFVVSKDDFIEQYVPLP